MTVYVEDSRRNTTLARRSILVVSETQQGKIHDYRKFKESEIPQGIPASVVCWFDNGFQGVATDFTDLMVRMPKRKRTIQA